MAAALVKALEPLGLSGIYDGPPARATYPYAAIDCGSERDWGHKSGAGREVAAAVTIWDEDPARLMTIAEAADAALGTLGNVSGWQMVSWAMLRRRTIRDVAGPWAVVIDHRARVLKD